MRYVCDAQITRVRTFSFPWFDLCWQEELVELLLDHFQVQACYLQEQAILAMYSYSAISGIVGESRAENFIYL